MRRLIFVCLLIAPMLFATDLEITDTTNTVIVVHDPYIDYGGLMGDREMDGIRLYHSGDTVEYPGLEDRLRHFKPDIAFLPINGTSARLAELQVPPNMNSADAVALAKVTGMRLTIPHHYDMFTFNTVDVSEFTRQADAAGVPYNVLHCGERFTWQKT